MKFLRNSLRKKLRTKILTKLDRRLATFPMNSPQRLYYHAFLSDRQFPKEFHKTKSIFIHTPKCAGSSIIKAFYNGVNVGHYPAIWYEGAHPQEFENYFKFSFVRNPFDRIVSTYHYLTQNQTKRNEPIRKFINEFKSFEYFILNWLNEENAKKIVVSAPQYLYLEDQFGCISHMDYIGKVESLDKDIQFVTDTLGFNGKLLKTNQSNRDDYRTYYTNEMIERVSSVYERDIKVFGYDFE